MINPRGKDSARSWHAVLCKPCQDGRAEENLLNQGFEIFRPKTRVRRTFRGRRRLAVESMFPRYLFVHLLESGEDWSPIRSTRGTVGLVRLGMQTPVVPETVIRHLRERCDAEGIISLKGAIDYQPDEFVDIVDGPFAGYRAIFQARSSEERVVVLLDLLARQRRIELKDTDIRRA